MVSRISKNRSAEANEAWARAGKVVSPLIGDWTLRDIVRKVRKASAVSSPLNTNCAPTQTITRVTTLPSNSDNGELSRRIRSERTRYL